MSNNIGLRGLGFVEFAGPRARPFSDTFSQLGFSLVGEHSTKKIQYYKQRGISFFLNTSPKASFAGQFHRAQGSGISSMGWIFDDPRAAYELALDRGANASSLKDYPLLAVQAPGATQIYFLSNRDLGDNAENLGFQLTENCAHIPDQGYESIDHYSKRVREDESSPCLDFYKKVFEFKEIQSFNIKNKKANLKSFTLGSPCGNFSIPVNETRPKNMMAGKNVATNTGICHVALLTKNILSSLRSLDASGIEFFGLDSEYSLKAFERLAEIQACKEDLLRRNVLVEASEEGYYMQAYTKRILDAICFGIIERNNHRALSEGHFQALFDAIEWAPDAHATA